MNRKHNPIKNKRLTKTRKTLKGETVIRLCLRSVSGAVHVNRRFTYKNKIPSTPNGIDGILSTGVVGIYYKVDPVFAAAIEKMENDSDGVFNTYFAIEIIKEILGFIEGDGFVDPSESMTAVADGSACSRLQRGTAAAHAGNHAVAATVSVGNVEIGHRVVGRLACLQQPLVAVLLQRQYLGDVGYLGYLAVVTDGDVLGIAAATEHGHHAAT